MGRCVGKAGEGRGYVPDPGRASGSGTATPGAGDWAVAPSASAPVRGLLGERSRADDADRIWALARVSCVRGVTPARDARRVRGQSAPSLALPSVALGERDRGGPPGALGRRQGPPLAPGRRLRPRGRLGVAPRRPGRQGVSPRRHPLRPDGPARGLRRPRRLAARLPHRRGRAARRGVARRPGRRRRRAVARRPRPPRRGRRRAAAGREQRPRHAAARGARGTRGRRGRDGPARAARLGARAQGDGGRAGGARRGRRVLVPRDRDQAAPGRANYLRYLAQGRKGHAEGGLSSAGPSFGVCVPRASLMGMSRP